MSATYTIVWTPTGGEATTLCDLSEGWWPVLEQLPAQANEQVDRLAFGDYVFRQPRGNVSGDVVFTVSHSHATLAAAAAWYKEVWALLAGQGALVITINTTTLTYALADFNRVEAVLIEGLRWTLRYSFGVTELS